jgi:hypothetical protein
MILILSTNTSDHAHAREHVTEQNRARIMFVNITQFTRCAPIRPEHSALEIFCYITIEMARVHALTQVSTPEQMREQNAYYFVLGLRLLAENTSVAHIIDDIIADWRRALGPAEIVALGRAHAIQIQSIIRARSELARIVNIDISPSSSAREDTSIPAQECAKDHTLVEVKLFLCQDLIDHAHIICAGQSDVTLTYSVRSSNLEYVLTCSGEHAREVINIVIDGESKSNPIIENTVSIMHDGARIQTWTARATHAQMCAVMHETARS